jgi:hypothetical protein
LLFRFDALPDVPEIADEVMTVNSSFERLANQIAQIT